MTETGFNFAHYGELRDVNATDGELAVFTALRSILADAGLDQSKLQLVRKSDSYVSAVIPCHHDKWGDYEADIARFKWTDRAKWITIPMNGTKKNKIASFADVWQFRDDIVRAYNHDIANAK